MNGKFCNDFKIEDDSYKNDRITLFSYILVILRSSNLKSFYFFKSLVIKNLAVIDLRNRYPTSSYRGGFRLKYEVDHNIPRNREKRKLFFFSW